MTNGITDWKLKIDVAVEMKNNIGMRLRMYTQNTESVQEALKFLDKSRLTPRKEGDSFFITDVPADQMEDLAEAIASALTEAGISAKVYDQRPYPPAKTGTDKFKLPSENVVKAFIKAIQANAPDGVEVSEEQAWGVLEQVLLINTKVVDRDWVEQMLRRVEARNKTQGKQTKYPLYSAVALAQDLPEHGLKEGQVATIVERYPAREGQEPGYSLEGFDIPGVTTVEVSESQIRPI